MTVETFVRMAFDDSSLAIDMEMKSLGVESQREYLCALHENITQRIAAIDEKIREEGPVTLKTWPIQRAA